jgi:hypothetical protein
MLDVRISRRSIPAGSIALLLAAIVACSSEVASDPDTDTNESNPSPGSQPPAGAPATTPMSSPPPAPPAPSSAPASSGEPVPSSGLGLDGPSASAPSPTSPPVAPATPRAGCLAPGSGDFLDDGPYPVATLGVDLGAGIAPNQGTGEFTIFHPEPFESGCPHPIVAWGNGTGVTGTGVYEFFNRHAASWGIVVIAAHDSNTGSGAYHRRGLDHLLALDDDPSSTFYGRLSPRAGVSGHSQGGFGASMAASHPNVQALLPIGASGRPLPSTAFLCLTGTEDIAPDACRSAVSAAPGPAMAAIWDGGDHVFTETLAGFLANDPGTLQMMRLYTAWFRCFLADDSAACDLFSGGSSCGVCGDEGWAEIVTANL